MTSATEDFEVRTAPYRRELLAHCYRMLGSLHDAEDMVQETFVRAWNAFERYDDRRASLRTWLYRIATNACLTALEGRKRRPLPSGIGGPSGNPTQALVLDRDLSWLQPLPEARTNPGSDPAAVLQARRGVRLAFVAALQLLPARQRAVLILRDVLEWPSTDVAEMLDTSTAAVNSTLQRARARLAKTGTSTDDIDEPADPELRVIVDRYVAAFEKADIPALRALLVEDAILEMPPYRAWFSGADDYIRFVEHIFARRGTDWSMVVTTANGQPAVGAYVRGDDAAYHAHSLQVFTVTRSGIARTTVFPEPALLPMFDLPPEPGRERPRPGGR